MYRQQYYDLLTHRAKHVTYNIPTLKQNIHMPKRDQVTLTDKKSLLNLVHSTETNGRKKKHAPAAIL
jgi:hypothetical protein